MLGFGGKVEAGETVEEAAKRELLEESGVTAQKLSLRGQLIFNVPSYPSTMVILPSHLTPCACNNHSNFSTALARLNSNERL